MASYPHMIFASESAELTKDKLVDIVTAALRDDDLTSEQSALKAVVARRGYPFTFWFEDADRVGEMYVDYLPEGARRRPIINAATVVDMSGTDDPDGEHADAAGAIVGALAATDGVWVFAEATKRFVGMAYGDEPAVPPVGAPTPEPAVSPAPAPTPEPAATPQPAPSPEPVPTPEPSPSPEPVPTPEPVPAPEPVAETTPQPVAEPVASEPRGDIGAPPVEPVPVQVPTSEPTPVGRGDLGDPGDIGAAPVTEPDGPLWVPPTREEIEHPVVERPAGDLGAPPEPSALVPAQVSTSEPAPEQPRSADATPTPAAPEPEQPQQEETGFFKRFFGRRR